MSIIRYVWNVYSRFVSCFTFCCFDCSIILDHYYRFFLCFKTVCIRFFAEYNRFCISCIIVWLFEHTKVHHYFDIVASCFAKNCICFFFATVSYQFIISCCNRFKVTISTKEVCPSFPAKSDTISNWHSFCSPCTCCITSTKVAVYAPVSDHKRIITNFIKHTVQIWVVSTCPFSTINGITISIYILCIFCHDTRYACFTWQIEYTIKVRNQMSFEIITWEYCETSTFAVVITTCFCRTCTCKVFCEAVNGFFTPSKVFTVFIIC